MDLNTIVDKIYVVCIPERKDNVIKIMKKLGIKYEIIDAVLKNKINTQKLIDNGFNKKIKTGPLACHLSHKKAVKTFLQSGAKNCIIFEDDIRVPTIEEIKYYYKCKKDLLWLLNREHLWTVIYLGKCWNSCFLNKKLKNNFLYAIHTFCTHSYILNRNSAKKFLEIPCPLTDFKYTNSDIDILMNKFFDKKVVAHPSLFFQNEKESTLERKTSILNFLGLNNLNNSGGLQCYTDLFTYKPVLRLSGFLFIVFLMIFTTVMIITYRKKISNLLSKK